MMDIAIINPALHPLQLRPYLAPAITALLIKLNGRDPCREHSSLHLASLADLIGVSP